MSLAGERRHIFEQGDPTGKGGREPSPDDIVGLHDRLLRSGTRGREANEGTRGWFRGEVLLLLTDGRAVTRELADGRR